MDGSLIRSSGQREEHGSLGWTDHSSAHPGEGKNTDPWDGRIIHPLIQAKGRTRITGMDGSFIRSSGRREEHGSPGWTDH